MRAAEANQAAVEDQAAQVLEVWPAAVAALYIAVERAAGCKGLAASAAAARTDPAASAAAARMGLAAAAEADKVYAAVRRDTADAESKLADDEDRVQMPVPADSADGTGNTTQLLRPALPGGLRRWLRHSRAVQQTDRPALYSCKGLRKKSPEYHM